MALLPIFCVARFSRTDLSIRFLPLKGIDKPSSGKSGSGKGKKSSILLDG